MNKISMFTICKSLKFLRPPQAIVCNTRNKWIFSPRNQFAYMDRESYLNKRNANRVSGFGWCLLAVPALTFSLGVWQIKRKKWKEQLLQDLSLKLYLPVIDLPEDLTNRARLEYRRVRVKGHFDHSNEMYIGPRQRIDTESMEKNDGLFTIGDEEMYKKNGVFVITPFHLADRNLTILVNRGWVPMDKKDPDTRREAQIEGEVELVGIVRLKEEKSAFLHDFDESERLFMYRDIGGMAQVANTSFLYIDVLRDYDIPGGPIGGQTKVVLRNQHLAYIITWFSVSGITSYLWYTQIFAKRL